jgi:undecaprenyl-diphosphatase
MNDRLQDLINGLADRSALLDSVMRFGAVDLVFLLAAIPPLLWLWPAPPARRAANQRVAASAVISVGLAVALAALLGYLHAESRPFVSDPGTRIFAAAIAGVLLAARPWLGAVAFAGVLAVGLARVFVGVHWPDDVLVAAAVGLLTGFAAIRAERLLIGPQRAFSRVLPAVLISPP